ncbi:VOC family protein [Cohnella yongneupensis]|uniref:VOC family protein n=1 Tax=Cohnella yongneupensis TaxID=425006 RepID=A0ABW0R047_9BACL
MSIRLTPYAIMNGNSKEAIKYYQDVLGAELLVMQTYGELPGDGGTIPEAAKNIVAHAMLKIGESNFVISDAFPGEPYIQGNNITIIIGIDGIDQTKVIFEKLSSDGGQVVMPLMETFFTPAYGKVTDKFGVNFQIICEKK